MDTMNTQNVLDFMTSQIGDRKTGKAAGLTPVGGEPGGPLAKGIPEVPGVFLTNEAVSDIAKDLRAQAATLLLVAESLEMTTQLVGVPQSAEQAALRNTYAKLAEIEADRRADDTAKADAGDTAALKRLRAQEQFDERMVEKARAAQEAAFSDAPAPGASTTWRCPDHPHALTKGLTSRKGRKYAACSVVNCQWTERL